MVILKIIRWMPLFYVFGLTGLSYVLSDPEAEDVPPMYTTHDFASGAMLERMTIPDGESCSSTFGSQLEKIVNEMEDNKEASEAFAEKLLMEFKEVMYRYEGKQLCFKESWCDMNICQPRPGLMGRSIFGNAGGSAHREVHGKADTNSSTSASIDYVEESSGMAISCDITTKKLFAVAFLSLLYF